MSPQEEKHFAAFSYGGPKLSLVEGPDEDGVVKVKLEDLKKFVEEMISSFESGVREKIEKMKAFVDYPDTEDGRKCRHENGLYNSALNKVLALLNQKKSHDPYK